MDSLPVLRCSICGGPYVPDQHADCRTADEKAADAGRDVLTVLFAVGFIVLLGPVVLSFADMVRS